MFTVRVIIYQKKRFSFSQVNECGRNQSKIGFTVYLLDKIRLIHRKLSFDETILAAINLSFTIANGNNTKLKEK